jgi:AICAR transformylase/IMP cyclohydrolase PurH
MIRDGSFDERARRMLAQKAFRITSAYDAAIAAWARSGGSSR